MKLLFSLSIFLAATVSGMAQTTAAALMASAATPYTDLDFDPKPTPTVLTGNDLKEDYVILKNKILTEYVYESNGSLVMYTTEHMHIHFNTQQGIDQRNKVFLSTRRVTQKMKTIARTIKKDGKVILLDKANIKEVDNYENQGPFTIFAMEGLETGDEIEYIYTFKNDPVLTDSRFMQSGSLKRNVSIEISSPSNLVFEARSYNGFPQLEKDTTLKERNRIFASIAEIRPVTEEKYSARKASLMRVDVKLAYNTANNRSRVQTFEKAATQFYDVLFVLIDKAEGKDLDKFVAKANLGKNMTDAEKIYTLENYIKTSIMVDDNAPEDNISKILKNKIATEMGITRLMLQAFKKAGFNPELVLTSDRFERKFDEGFDTWSNFTDFLLYFPETSDYIAPDQLFSRYGFPPAELTNNKGLFIKEIEIGDIKSGVGKIKTIKANEHSKSYSNIDAFVTIDMSTLTPNVKNTSTSNGYAAYFTQPLYSFMNEEQKAEFGRNASQLTGEETKVLKYEVKNTEQKDVFLKPFIIESEVECPHLIEKAGDKILFKAGELIGPQAELYQEGVRMTDAEIEYSHSFTRNIEIAIPDGYKLSNPDDVKLLAEFNDNGTPQAQFKSTYELKDNKIIIHVYEDYRALLYPIARFEDFKNVINAAADFNKVTLIFEKI